MKRVLLLLAALLMLATTPMYADSFEFVLDDFGVNNDFLLGFFPSFLTAGARYTGLEFIDGQTSDLIFITGGGYSQRQVWRDDSGKQVVWNSDDEDDQKFNVITAEWKVLLEQGIFWSDRTYSDLITMYGGLLGRFEHYMENKGGSSSRFFDDAFYPEGDQLLSHAVTGGVRLETVKSEKVVKNGVDFEVSAVYAPAWMLNESFFDSSVDYLNATAVLEGYYLLYHQRRETGFNTVSVFLADRVRADYISGDAVPVYAQKDPSLGYKMRGFQSYSYATTFNVVNNFDIRIAGPEVVTLGLFPRGGLFFDVGYYTGHFTNTPAVKESGMLMSTGVEAAFSFFDFLNLGVRGNYVLAGDTLTGEDVSFDIFLTMHY